jgi:hypothetical protein
VRRECGGSGLRKLNGYLAAEVECVKDFFDETDVVLGDDSAGVAGLVGYSGGADVEGKMEGEFAGDVTGRLLRSSDGLSEDIVRAVARSWKKLRKTLPESETKDRFVTLSRCLLPAFPNLFFPIVALMPDQFRE